jgi:hypothetical protein
MMLTDQDRLEKLFVPLARTIMPPAALDRQKRIDYALGDDGKVQESAMPPLSGLHITSTIDDTAYNSTSTSVYTTCVETTITLGDGTWTLIVNVMSRGAHSAGTSIDYRINVNSDAYNEITRTAPAAAAAPFFTTATVTAVPGGDVAIAAEFKCDAGSTATISDSVLTVIAMRTA